MTRSKISFHVCDIITKIKNATISDITLVNKQCHPTPPPPPPPPTKSNNNINNNNNNNNNNNCS